MIMNNVENNEFFASTRQLKNIYRLLAEASKKNIEKRLNKKTKFLIIKKKFPSFNFIIFFLKVILLGKIFSSREYILLKYKNCKIGRYAYPQVANNIETFYSPFKSIVLRLKCLFLAGAIIDTAYFLSKKICGAYVDHGVYLNGLYIEVFLKNNIRIYSNNYPKGLFTAKVSGKLKENFTYDDLIKIHGRKINNKQKKIAQKIIDKTLTDSRFIPWMEIVKYKDPEKKINYGDYQYIVYASAFTDAQLAFGYDGYANMKDWLIDTIRILRKLKKKVLVKPHPNFYDYLLLNLDEKNKKNNISFQDHTMYQMIKNKYANEHICFLDQPYSNIKFMGQLNKKKHIIVTRHSSAILEISYQRFKVISSKSTLWNEKVKLTNAWKDKIEYEKILSKDFKKLIHSKRDDVLRVFNEIYFNETSPYGKKNFIKLLKKNLGVKQFSRFDTSYDALDKMIKKSETKTLKTINAISQNIEEIRL